MDAAAFGLSRDPFERNSDIDEQCLPNPLAALLSELQAGLRSPQGLSVLIAEESCGKSLLARIFARRLAGRARAALIASPGPTLSTIVHDALAQLGAEPSVGTSEDELIHMLIEVVTRRAEHGESTAIVIDDAHRLSPQTLAGLARLFCDDSDEPPRLHLFLFGRPDLLDRMNATTDRALLEHLLQICRIEPLPVRDCIRYLERRLAAAAGELGTLFVPEAIDDLIVASGGRLLRLEAVASASLVRAQRSRSAQVHAEHVRAADAEGTAMAGDQQKLRLERAAAGTDDDEVTWGDEPEEEEEWSTDDEDGADEVRLSWGAATDGDEDSFETGSNDDGERGTPLARRREGRRGSLVAMGMFSVAACVLLTWAAQSVQAPERDAPGRTAEMFPKPVASDSTEIVRLPSAVSAATRAKAKDDGTDDGKQMQPDANAHLALWSSRDTSIDTRADDDIEIRQLDAEVHEADGEVMWEEELAASERERPRFPSRDRAERERQERDEAKQAQEAARQAALPPSSAQDAQAASGRHTPPGIAEAMGSAEPSKPARPSYEDAPHIVQAKAEILTKPAPAPKAKPAAKPAPTAPTRTTTKTPPAPTAKAATKASATTLYTIQLGAFRTRANAEELVAKLGNRRVRIVSDAGMFRVMSGAFDNKRDATAHEASLRRAGFNTFVREVF